MFTQVAGITLATPTTWRLVFFISFIVAVLQLLFSSMIVESPTWLFNQSRLEEHKNAVTRLWGNDLCKMTDPEPLFMAVFMLICFIIKRRNLF